MPVRLLQNRRTAWMFGLTLLFGGFGCAAVRTSATPLDVSASAVNDTSPAISASSPTWWPGARNPHRDAWNAWACNHLQSGDIVFLRGECRILMDLVDFSEFVTQLTGSPWSHVGLVVVEDREVVVYDIVSAGTRRLTFGAVMSDPLVHVAEVCRPMGETAEAIPQAAAFAQEQHRRGVRFDHQFRHDNDRLYCSELVEAAYRAGGVELSQPVKIADLPGYGKDRRVEAVLHRVVGIDADQAVYLPGNADRGLRAHSDLQQIALIRDTRQSPDVALSPGESR